jgi:NAD/NADP transhydrogenase beta subunit
MSEVWQSSPTSEQPFFSSSVPGRLSNQETARRGNLYGMIGMTIAVLATYSAHA